jgi:hypothetical protein
MNQMPLSMHPVSSVFALILMLIPCLDAAQLHPFSFRNEREDR